MTQPTDRPGINQLRQRLARAIHRYDNHHALSGNDTPSEHHYGEADAALAELERELSAFAEYENAINWMTTCLSCARVLDSSIRETERAEQAEAAIERVRQALAERRAEIADYETENEPAAWSDAAANTCSRIEDALRQFPEPQGIRAVLDQHGQTPA